MKAGLIELPDVFVVNKADQGPLAERTARELEAGLGLGERDGAVDAVRVVLASARDGRGIDAVLGALDELGAALAAGGRLAERRRRGRDRFALQALAARYGSYGLAAVGGADAVAERLAGERGARASRSSSGSGARSKRRSAGEARAARGAARPALLAPRGLRRRNPDPLHLERPVQYLGATDAGVRATA